MTAGNHLISVNIVELQPHGEVVAVFLKGPEPRVVPILIGASEAQSLHLAIQGKQPEYPGAYDIMESVMGKRSAVVRQLVIHTLCENTFFAYLSIEHGAQPLLIDCRPSDGMVMAKRGNAPIFITPEVLEAAGVDFEGR